MTALPRVIFASGKGGVGKTTLTAALAWLCHQRGERVLLLSTDPAHNLSDLFHLPAGRGQRHRLDERWLLWELDPEEELTRYLDEARERMLPFLGAQSRPMLGRYLDFVRQSPGSGEAAVFHQLAQLLANADQQGWQRIICDTAPSGHTLQLLRLPEQLDEWGQLLARKQGKSDRLQGLLLGARQEERKPSITEHLRRRSELYHNFRHLLTDPARCAVVLVVEAQRLAVAETARTAAQLEQQQVFPYALCLNRLMQPPLPQEGDFYRRRRALEADYCREIEQQWPQLPLWRLPLQDREVDVDNLATLAHLLEPQLCFAASQRGASIA